MAREREELERLERERIEIERQAMELLVEFYFRNQKGFNGIGLINCQ